MPVDRNKKLVFVHIPKTAGTSVEVAMDIIHYKGEDNINLNKAGKESSSIDNLFGNSLQHLSSIEIYRELQKLGSDAINYKFFTILRDPSDKLLSHYLGRKKGWLRSSNQPVNNIIQLLAFLIKLTFSRPIVSITPNGSYRFIKKRLYPQYEHIRSQSSYLNGCPVPVEIWDFARLRELSDRLEELGYEKLPEYRVNKRIPSKLVKGIIDYYAKTFYKKDHCLYKKIKLIPTPCNMVNGDINESI